MVHSRVLLIHTDTAGDTKLFAAGRYDDELDGDVLRIIERVIYPEIQEPGPAVCTDLSRAL